MAASSHPDPFSPAPGPTADSIQDWLVRQLAERLGVAPQTIDAREPFDAYGLSSSEAVALSGDLENWLGRRLPGTLVYDYPTPRALARHLAGEGEAETPTAAAGPSTEPVAIIGIGCRVPGAATPEAFWQMLANGVDAIREVPADRWDVDALYDPDPAAPGKMSTRWGGFLDGVDQFDAPFFGISPREAARIDPQQRLLLEVAWEALEDAGLPPDRLAGSRTAVYVGIATNDYGRRLLGDLTTIDAYAGTSIAFSIAANRLSYFFDFRGPSLAVDTACSSSLAAVWLACKSLWAGEATLALAGGVNLILEPVFTINFSKAGAMAADGRCKAFDSRADGYVRGEGAGVVVLKPLAQALADGDPIYAVIRGGAVNQDGRTNGLMAPNSLAQEAVLRDAYRNANVSPGRVQYVEAHGTGTLLGDPIEVNALGAVLAVDRPADRPCAIGSVKTNLGHLEAAAGVAGLIKVALALKHRQIPPSLHFQQPNPHIPFDSLPLTVQRALGPWPAHDGPALAGVSSFGFGGTNVHLVLSEGPLQDEVDEPPAGPDGPCLISLSARSPESLQTLARAWQSLDPTVSLADLAAGAATRRSHHDHRLAVVAQSRQELSAHLSAFLNEEPRPGLSWGRKPAASRRRLVFVFPGQGSQWVGMGRALLEQAPAFRQAVERCAAAMQPYIDWPLVETLMGEGEAAALDRIDVIQPAVFAMQVALAALWRSWGIEPDGVIGHSMGEAAAACAAGALSLEDAAQVVCRRSRMMRRFSGQGSMAIVGLTLPEAQRALAGCERQVAVAASNSPALTVLSGEPAVLGSILETLQGRDVFCRTIKVDVASHSPQMDGLRAPLLEALAGLRPQPAALPMYSTLLGAALEDTPLDAAYWARNLREPVLFAPTLQKLLDDGHDLFLELSPHPTLTTAIDDCLQGAGREGTVLVSLRRDRDCRQTVLGTLGTLYTQGRDVDWAQLYAAGSTRRVQLPHYPFRRARHWLDARPEGRASSSPRFEGGQACGDYGRCAPTAPPEHDARAGNGASGVHSMKPAASPVVEMAVPAPAARKEDIVSRVREIVARLLDAAPSDVDVHLPFIDMGADSIVVLDAIRRIQAAFGVKFTVRQLFEELNTIDVLSTYIDQRLPPPASEPPPAPPAAAAGETFTAPAPAAPAVPLETAAPGSMIERVMAQQLAAFSQIVGQQLHLLQGRNSAEVPAPAPLPVPPGPDTTSGHGRAGIMDASRRRAGPVDTEPRPLNGSAGSPALAKSAEPAYVAYKRVNSKAGGDLDARQQKHLAALIERLTQRTAGSKQRTQQHRSRVADIRSMNGFRLATKEMLYPITVSRAQDARLWDVDGNVYVDLMMGFGTNLFGHRPAFVVEALERQIKDGFPLGPRSGLVGEVAELFCELTGSERVAFFTTGSEAVMVALRLARTATGRTRIALFSGAYHGQTDGTLVRKSNDSPLGVLPMAPGISPQVANDVLILDYDRPESLDLLRAHAHELAAVLVEPVQSRRPDLQPREFLHQLRQLTAESGAALIFDEMVTGFRIGAGGAQAWFGIQADLATYGKIVGGGMPIGVVAGRAAFMDSVDGGQWQYGDLSYPSAETTFVGGTFSQQPLSLAAARAVLYHIKAQGPALYEDLNGRAERFTRGLQTHFDQTGAPIQMARFGSLFRFSFSGYRDVLFYHLLEKGVYGLEWCSSFLATAHADADLDLVSQAVKESVAEMQAGGLLPEAPTARPPSGSPAAPDSFPLTEAQKQIWTLAQMGTDSSLAYNETVVLKLHGPLHPDRLREVLQTMVDRYDALRLTIDPAGEVQRVLSSLRVDLPAEAVSLPDGAEAEASLAGLLREESRRPFDLSRGPLFRARLLRRDAQSHWLVFTAHHIIVDGWSIGLMLHELCERYTALCQGRPLPVEPAMQFGEFVRRQDDPAALADHEVFWLEQFADPVPALRLPIDRPRPKARTYHGARLTTKIDPRLTAALKQFSRQQGSTLFITLLSAYLALLHRLSGQHDVVVGVPTATRSVEGSEMVIGYCTDMLPVRSRLAGRSAFKSFLAGLKKKMFEIYDHQDYTYARLSRALKRERAPHRIPALSATFNLERSVSLPPVPGLAIEVDLPAIDYAKFDLSLNVAEIGGDLRIDLDYNTDLFDPATVARLQDSFLALVEAAIADPDQPLDRLPLLTPAERQQLLTVWSTGGDAPQHEADLLAPFEARVDRAPGSVAVELDGQRLTYSQLNARANQVAHHLRGLGVGPDVCVGVYLERSLEAIVSLLGILKAGGAYVPLDPAYPPERIGFILNDLGQANPQSTPVLLTRGSRLADLPPHRARVICLEADRAALESESQSNLSLALPAASLAYVIYTSGSTGQPKGVCISRQTAAAHLAAARQAFGLTESDRVLQFASLSFDVSLEQILTALFSGAALILRGPSIWPAAGFIQFVSEAALTVCNLPPAYWQQVVQAWTAAPGVKAPPALRLMIVGGDALNDQTVQGWQQLAPSVRLLNAYGPTETAITAALFEVPGPGDPGRLAGKIPIGRPLPGRMVYILDRAGEPVPVGVPGELAIGGDLLARGYLGRPGLTADRFVPDPFAAPTPTPLPVVMGEGAGARLYRTGDLARWLPDGDIEFIGRVDHQVKIRGFRIEPGEIEAALARHPGVREAVVAAYPNGSGEKRLVAYVVARPEADVSADSLRGFLKARLPDHLIPSGFLRLEALPLTPGGKIDRQALPPPDADQFEVEAAYAEPRSPMESLLCRLWAEVLGRSRVGIHDDFFALGGDSILSIQITARANQAGLSLTPQLIFEHSTVAGLAVAAEAPVVRRVEPAVVSGPVPLTPIQHWFFEQSLLDPHHFNQAFLFEARVSLSLERWAQVVQALAAHHDSLRLRFARGDESGWQQRSDGAGGAPDFAWVDLSALPGSTQPAAVEAAAADCQASLDLASGSLLKVRFFDLGPGRPGRLLVVIHHLAVDGVSWRILMEDLQLACEQSGRGDAIRLPARTSSFSRWAARLSDYARSSALRDEIAFWMAAQQPVPPLPVDAEGGPDVEAMTDEVRVELSAEDTHALLREVPAAYRTRVNDALLAALLQAFEPWTGEPRLRVALEGHGREAIFDDLDLSRTVGWFTTLFPVTLERGAAEGPEALLKSVSAQLRRIPRHGLGYGVLKYLCPDRAVREALHALPEPQICFNYLGQFDQVWEGTGFFRQAPESSGPASSPRERRLYALEINCLVAGGRLLVSWRYNRQAHRRATVAALAGRFVESLQALAGCSRAPSAAGYSPMDFPDSGLDQSELDDLIAELN